MSESRFVIGAGRIASGRSPSIERMMTRRADGVKVGVKVGEGVSVGVVVRVGVCEAVGASVCVAVAVGVPEAVGARNDSPGAAGI
jgi:hypothetical protein